MYNINILYTPEISGIIKMHGELRLKILYTINKLILTININNQ